MLYTVKEVSSLSNVTIKTLHHYHKIGLLLPGEVSEAGYRLYGIKQLERLQQILFYKELDFTLDQIKHLLEGDPDPSSIFAKQEKLLLQRKQRLETIIETLRKSISRRENGEQMDDKEMFKGFASEEEWESAMEEQNKHLKETYDVELNQSAPLDIQNMNDLASEAASFMTGMAEALRAGLKHNDEKIGHSISNHLAFLNEHGHNLSAADFAAQTRFFLADDFHLQMLEGQQTGLAYYLSAAADAYAAAPQP
ncbi:MerR family transcriptional regulator [Paenibacillus nasutitermitis]|uniref:MerR family transcriptional regulator n=1 Tax=Paenibacillus nasutitermitis TaxID=1652958 RepID=A0A917DP57_9BACL|nr:MerR family transcriptional regulator [Paenibacillus nasutitermitis]GGD53293.1 MerR family transcriptional regulator [Paenibacillus nasutitermitis]